MPQTQHNIAMDLPQLGLLHVTGADAKKFLQGQLTCNLDDITETESRLGAHCNPQGRILSLFRIFYFQENYYLQMPIEMVAETIQFLKKFAVFFKVNMQDASGSFRRAGFQGTGLQTIFPHLLEKQDAVTQEENILIVRLAGETPRYEFIGDANVMTEILTELHAETANDATTLWKAWQISSGIPAIYASTSGKFLPHEINLPLLNGVSFEKGCYTGQEIIARMHYRGQLKKKMFIAHAQTTDCPAPGSDIYQDAPSGTVVDSCLLDNHTCLLLVIADEQTVSKETLFLDTEKKPPLEFTPLALGNTHV